MREAIERLIEDLGYARATGAIYTYGQVQEMLRSVLAAEDDKE